MILKDMVLDITEYINNHPGGKFVLEKCIGRDISKYFDGGYSFESNTKPIIHSNLAYKTCISVCIGTLIRKSEETVATIVERDVLYENAQTITWLLRLEVEHMRAYYSDINIIGRYYMITPRSNPKLVRYYTICNCI